MSPQSSRHNSQVRWCANGLAQSLAQNNGYNMAAVMSFTSVSLSCLPISSYNAAAFLDFAINLTSAETNQPCCSLPDKTKSNLENST
jgi:hypothetical protein